MRTSPGQRVNTPHQRDTSHSTSTRFNSSTTDNRIAMPATATPTLPPQTRKKRRTSALSKARDRLRGVIREDSDDELGLEDHPWEWVYSPTAKHRIVGARMGSFDVHIGDCLLIKGEGLKGEAYVGMACEFAHSKEGMMCNVNWFSTESEVRRGGKKRGDFLPVRGLLSPFGRRVADADRMNSTSTPPTTKSPSHPSTAVR